MIKSHDFASTYVGTPFYMSPEICAAEKYTLKSDIWSLGCIIYELCSREPPFNAKTHFQLVQRIKEGKVVPLPEMYSAELNQVIKDCLRVNPDRRPDTTQLLNLPIVKLMRKEKEVADLNKKLRTKADELSKKEEEINDKLANLDHDLELKKAEIDLSLRREWEVKAHLEIERLAQVEVERLKKVFDEAVRVQVEERLRKVEEQPRAETPASPPAAQVAPVAKPDRPDYPHSSIGTSSDEFSSTTDVTDLSVDSSDHHNEPKKTARTPFGRAQTMFVGNAGTPMDISPSPVALASLSLSPRRTGAAKAPHLPDGNIFSKNNGSEDPKWTIPREALEDSEEDDFFVPSPTRQIKSTQHNPFTSKSRPVLTSQKSCPINRLRPQPSSSGLVSKVGLGQPPEPTARSPTRRLSKIPSAANLAGENAQGGLARKPSTNRKDKDKDMEALGKVAAKNNIKGRTLVELQQARAGGRHVVPSSPKRPAAIWDPETDEMPSPFIVRNRPVRTAKEEGQ